MTLHFPSIPDELSLPSIEQRALRACKTIRALPDRETRYLRVGCSSIWRETLHDWNAYDGEVAQAELAKKVRFVPTPADVSDCLPMLEICCQALDKREFKLIWWRSFDNVSFATMAARIGRSDETARRRFNEAVDKIWLAAFRSHLSTAGK